MSESGLIRQWDAHGLAIPERLDDFLRMLGGPSWLQVNGRDRSRRRLIVTLLHGNEPSGLHAVHNWLRSGREAAVDTIIYIGSVGAALHGRGFAFRSLPGERDANRCYGAAGDDIQGRIAGEVTALFRRQAFEAVIDIHNNTGHNPAYGIGYGIDRARLNLTDLFADWYVLSDLHMDTLVEMTGAYCPSISIECGRAGDPAADATALAGLERFLHLDCLGLDGPPPRHMQILEHPHRVFLEPDIDITFASTPHATAALTLREDLDRHNFAPLDVGTVLGWVQPGFDLPLSVRGAAEREMAGEFFTIDARCLKTRQPMIPIMMTTDLAVARSDCLFYAMAPVQQPADSLASC